MLLGKQQIGMRNHVSDNVSGSEQLKNISELRALGNELSILKQRAISYMATSPTHGVQTSIQSFPKPGSKQVRYL